MAVVLQTLLSHLKLAHPASLLAYIDPSTGSLIFQVVAASAISAGLFVKGLRERLMSLIGGGWRTKPRSDAPADSDATVPGDTSADAAKSRRKAA